MASPGADVPRYLIVRPQNGGIPDLLRFWWHRNMVSGAKFLEISDYTALYETLVLGNDGSGGGGVTPDHRWVIVVSIIVRKLIMVFRKPMEWTGYLVEFILNLLSLSAGLPGLIYNILRGKVVVPQRGSETFISVIVHLDGRIDLYKGDLLLEVMDKTSDKTGMQINIVSRPFMDLCMMAAKLAYENAQVVKNVVNYHWKMHFVDFYNCWNDYQKERSTQVYMLCDKPKDANLIIISFRGTESFDADDWSTDFDYSWYEIPKLGKVHVGFLEALGLGNRLDMSTFQQLLQVNHTKVASPVDVDVTKGPSKASNRKSSSTDSNGMSPDSESSEKKLVPAMGEMTAYFAVRSKLKSLLDEHKNAKFVVTGHSLGGALAILFPTVLVLHEEKELMKRLLAAHTFGQPRVGNWQLGKFMEAHLEHPVPKYFRVVYCNDLIPRLPFDDRTFFYKHFGVCLYYNGFYVEQRVNEEPNPNYFGLQYLIRAYLIAIWELVRGLIKGYLHGPDYKESWLSILLRIIGLALPGISAHSPTNYVDSIRLGMDTTIQMLSL